jgi:hypothetical protein
MYRFLPVAPLALLFLPPPCIAAPEPPPRAKVVIDEHGARPRRFRISAIDFGVDAELNPTIFRPTFLGRSSKPVTDEAGEGAEDARTFRLGIRAESLVMTQEKGGAAYIVGDASNLDDIRLVPGFKVWAGPTGAWGPWQVRSNLDEVTASLEVFEGTSLRFEWARDRALAMASGREPMNPANFRVVSEILVNHWERVSTQDGNPREDCVDQVRATYVSLVDEAAAGADRRHRALLAELNGEVLGRTDEVRRHQGWAKDWSVWHDPGMDDLRRRERLYGAVLEIVRALQLRLSERPGGTG